MPASCLLPASCITQQPRGLCVGAAAARKLLPGCRHAAHMPPAPLACLHHGCSALVCSRRSTGVPGWDPARQQLHHAAVAQLEASRGACESCAVLPQVCNHPLHMTSHPTCHIDTCSRPQQCIPTCLAVPWATASTHPPAGAQRARPPHGPNQLLPPGTSTAGMPMPTLGPTWAGAKLQGAQHSPVPPALAPHPPGG